MRSFTKFFPIAAIASLAIVFIAGCKTTPPVDWQARVGTCTYDQAVTELGPPDRQTKLTDGKTVAKWITHRGGGTSIGIGTGFYNGNTAVGAGQSIGSGYSDRVLTLTFGTDNVLTAWSKNY